MNAPPDHVIEAARQAALKSICQKTQRGAAIFGVDQAVVATGYNLNHDVRRVCDGSPECRRDCGKICEHAEAMAIRVALASPVVAGMNIFMGSLGHYDLVHVKIIVGKVVAGGPPSCWQCSKLISNVGLGGVWLFEEIPFEDDLGKWVRAGWVRYSAREFHEATLKNEGLFPSVPERAISSARGNS